jgi:hypothetical protein
MRQSRPAVSLLSNLESLAAFGEETSLTACANDSAAVLAPPDCQ